jgi:hypothetical protein
VGLDYLSDAATDCLSRVERRIRILKDELNSGVMALQGVTNTLTKNLLIPCQSSFGRRLKSDNQSSQSGFSTTAFTNNSKSFASLYLEGNSI